MPLFATLVGAAINGLVKFYGLALGLGESIVWARRTFIIALWLAFLAAVSVCVKSLLGAIVFSGLPRGFVMGLGMFIPSNAVAVLACVGSVWLACVIVRLKVDGLKW